MTSLVEYQFNIFPIDITRSKSQKRQWSTIYEWSFIVFIADDERVFEDWLIQVITKINNPGKNYGTKLRN